MGLFRNTCNVSNRIICIRSIFQPLKTPNTFIQFSSFKMSIIFYKICNSTFLYQEKKSLPCVHESLSHEVGLICNLVFFDRLCGDSSLSLYLFEKYYSLPNNVVIYHTWLIFYRITRSHCSRSVSMHYICL